MSEDIKGLIEKINKEGVAAAEQKAAQIEAAGRKKSDEIISRAEKEAQRLIAEANEKIALMEEKQRTLLAQAGRDLLLNLKKEIEGIFERIISTEVHNVLSKENLGKLIVEIAKTYAGQIKGDVIVTLKKEDVESLGPAITAQLKDIIKKGVTLKSSQEISGGFTISFDAGKSCFDFTDTALAGYIGSSLKPKLKELLDRAVKGA